MRQLILLTLNAWGISMKPVIHLILLLFSFQISAAELKLEDLVKQVSEKNYLVYENALKVYQSRTDIDRVRGELLPKLNIWNIASALIDPLSLVDSISDIAPFLVPANWFRLEEVKLLYLSEKEGYRALWGNELHSAKTLFLHTSFDMQLLKHVKDSIVELNDIHLIVKTREMLGGAEPGTARDIEIRILGLMEDEKNLAQLVNEELNALTYALGLPSDVVQLAPVIPPDIKSLKRLEYGKYEFRLLANSPERRQFEHFFSVLKQIKKEIQYAFMGGSSISRGVAGGIFDALPTSGALSFGNAPAMKIIDAQKEIMLTQRTGIEETLKRQLKNLVYLFNSDVSFFDNFSRRLELTRESKVQLLRRIKLGENVSMLALADASKNQIQAETSIYAVQYRVMSSLDRLDRLVFQNDYSLQPPLIDSLKGDKP